MSGAKPWLVPEKSRFEGFEWKLDTGEPLNVLVHKPRDSFRPILTGKIDLQGVREDIKSEAPLAIAVLLDSGGTGSRERKVVYRSPLPEGTSAISIQLGEFRYSDLSGRVVFQTTLVVAEDCEPSTPVSPHISGSLLWDHQFVLPLIGKSRGFPLVELDFEQYFPRFADAPWYVEVPNANLSAPFQSSVILFVNSADKEICQRLETGDGPTVRLLRGDIVRSVLFSVLLNPDLEADVLLESEEGTLGAEVVQWLNSLESAEPVEEIVRQLRDSPHKMGARIMSLWGKL